MSATLWPPRQDGPLPLPRPEHWTELALCAEVGSDFWYPEKGGSTREPKQICRSCPVQPECLEYALENCERFGVWGGTTERQRRAILAGRQPGVPRCESGWHALAGENLLPGGGCQACSDVRSVRIKQTRREGREFAAHHRAEASAPMGQVA